MGILLNILIGLVVLIVILAAIGLALPRRVGTERSVTIDAAPEAIFPHLNSLRRMGDWSPWLGRDPEIVVTHDGPEEGVGAKMAWVSQMRNVGSGKQEITASVANERVDTALDFGSRGTAEASLALAPDAAGTRVTWSFSSDLGTNPVARWFGLMIPGFVGKDYEAGLARLKALIEG